MKAFKEDLQDGCVVAYCFTEVSKGLLVEERVFCTDCQIFNYSVQSSTLSTPPKGSHEISICEFQSLKFRAISGLKSLTSEALASPVFVI